MSVPCHIPPSRAELIPVIYLAARGDGSPGNPERIIHLYFSRMGAYSPATTRKTDRRMRSSRQSFALTWRDKNSLLVGSFALMPGQAEMS